jgi:hypothetical protein
MELLERLAANDPELTVLYDVPPSVGMRELATALALNTTLTHLRLSGRGLVAAEVHELAGALEEQDSQAAPLDQQQHRVRRRSTWLQLWSTTTRSRRSTWACDERMFTMIFIAGFSGVGGEKM